MLLEPPFGWRFLRHSRYGLPVRSYSAPSGLTEGMIQISLRSTMFVIRVSEP